MECNALVATWVVNAQTLGVELQARHAMQNFVGGVKRLAQNGVSYFRQMHAELVRAPCDRLKPQARNGHVAALALHNTPLRLRWFAMFVTDHLFRAVFPITYKGQINQPCVFGWMPKNARNIGFGDFTVLELFPDIALRGLIQRHQEYARCFHVKAVDQQAFGELLSRPNFKGILLIRFAPRNTQQIGGLG